MFTAVILLQFDFSYTISSLVWKMVLYINISVMLDSIAV